MGFLPGDIDHPSLNSSQQLIRGSQESLQKSQSRICRSDRRISDSLTRVMETEIRRDASIEGSIRPLVLSVNGSNQETRLTPSDELKVDSV